MVVYFVMKQQVKNWEEELKHHPKRKQTNRRRKLKKFTRKLHHSSINLLNKICFRWRNSLVIITNRQYSKYSKRTMQSTITVASQTISRNWRDLWRKERDHDKKKEAEANKRSKRSDIEETPPVVLGEYKFLFCGVADDVSNFCAGGTQHATSKKINEEKNRAFSNNIWRQASKLQGSRVLSFLSLGSAAVRERNYHRVCLTEFHSRYQALVTADTKELPFDWFKTELHFRIIVMHVLDQRRLGVDVFRVTELEKIYTELLLEDCIEYTPHVTMFVQRLKVELKPFFYCNNGVETRRIGKAVSLCFSEDVGEIISNELQNPTTLVTSLVGLISSIRQAMSKVSNTFNNSFPPDCQKASLPIQHQIIMFLANWWVRSANKRFQSIV